MKKKESFMPAPVALFAYKRPDHLNRTLKALSANPESVSTDLVIFSDGAKKREDQPAVDAVRKLIREPWPFRSIRIVEKSENWGLARSIIQGVTEVTREFGRVIVVEDDIVVVPFFLEYMNRALDLYAEDTRVASIHGYVYPTSRRLPDTFFLRGADCWGWATWGRAWKCFEADGAKLRAELETCPWKKEFDFDGTGPFTDLLEHQVAGGIDSWAIRWHAATFMKGMYTLYPGRSLVENIGFDGSGTHSGESQQFRVRHATVPPQLQRMPVETHQAGYQAFKRYFQGPLKDRILRKAKRLIKRILFRK